MKVYVLVYDSISDWNYYRNISIFSSLEDAQSAMEEDIKSKSKDLERLTESYHNNDGACWLEPGYYGTEHIEWTIYERDIID